MCLSCVIHTGRAVDAESSAQLPRLLDVMDVHCPHCGQKAKRRVFLNWSSQYDCCPQHRVQSTACEHCDYLMVVCEATQRVLESYF